MLRKFFILPVGVAFVALAMIVPAHAQEVSPSSKVIKDLQIRGRVQTQVGYVNTDNDWGSDDYSTMEVRRARIGLRGTLFDNVRAQVEANVVPGSSFSMRSAFIQWREHKEGYIKVGFDKPYSSIEENTSSAEIITIERTLINGLVAAPGPLNGISLEGAASNLIYGAGIYTDTENTNATGTNSEYLGNLMVGVKLDEFVGQDNKMLLRASYLNSNDPLGVVGRKYDDVMTGGFHFKTGDFDLYAEYLVGDMDGSKNKGFYLTPAFHFTEKIQGVIRLEHAESDKTGGISAPSRYARRVPYLAEGPGQKGDEYQALYAGINYYISGHGHKLMFGIEKSALKNTDAGTLDALTLGAAWRMLF